MSTINEHAASLGGDGSIALALQRESVDLAVVAHFVVEGEPASKSRARWSPKTKRMYTPQATVDAENRVAWSFKDAARDHVVGADGKFGVFASFWCGTGHRRDVDNMTKLVLDGLNGVAWADDMQVTEISAKIQRYADDPRTEVVIYRTLDQGQPTKPCQQCGESYPYYPSQKNSRKFCSAACGYAWRRAQNSRTCSHCGGMFQSKASRPDVTYCSMKCRRSADGDNQVTIACRICGHEFALRPSELRRRSNPTCSVQCAAQARRKNQEAHRA